MGVQTGALLCCSPMECSPAHQPRGSCKSRPGLKGSGMHKTRAIHETLEATSALLGLHGLAEDHSDCHRQFRVESCRDRLM